MNTLLSLISLSTYFLILSTSFGQQAKQIVTLSNPPTVATPRGYSHLAEIDLGTAKMVLIAGQVGLDVQGNVVGKGDPKAQFEQIFRNLQALVTAAGGKMEDLVKLTVYFRDMSHVQLFRDVRDQYVNHQHPPTSTAVEVSKLFRDDILAEVEATAIIPKGK
ncbi:RidA family protein [Spirosoma sp. BT702]|uniref:RidA family protein n=1 Tax=Spirosoma profusum TaxID=2771354 RepID=A0A926Y073_9BACT|nr:RidA family protein [Spirosoma profusum]MBD2704183.1 RidA family protein [Spirosoma profusum]